MQSSPQRRKGRKVFAKEVKSNQIVFGFLAYLSALRAFAPLR
jgi:hypothetical protein